MSVARTARAKRRQSSRSSKSSRRKPAAAAFIPGLHDARDAMRLIARSRVEADLIAAALADAPPLDREIMGADVYPFNGVASSEAVEAVVVKLVRRRSPDNPWNDVHPAMCKTDQSGHGYWAWIDLVRDASFQCGVDYALRALPDWWADFQKLSEGTRRDIAQVVGHAVEGAR